jgi:hypothetical protein
MRSKCTHARTTDLVLRTKKIVRNRELQETKDEAGEMQLRPQTMRLKVNFHSCN